MMETCFSVHCVFMTWMVLYFHSNQATSFTISGNSTGIDGTSVSQGDSLKLTCSSSRNDILLVDWYNKPRGNSYFPTSPTVVMKLDAGGKCLFDPTYQVPTNMNCGCVSISNYTCTFFSVETDMKGNMWRCSFTYGNQASSANTNELTIDLTVGITSTVVSSPTDNPTSVIVNTERKFQCQTSPGNPVASVVWYKDNKTPSTADDIQITSGTSTSSTPDGDLVVTHGTLTLQVQRNDQDLGVYCRARNMEQWFTSGTKRMNVLYGPKTKILQDLSLVKGVTLVIPCLYTPGNPSASSFEWTRSGTSASWVKQNTQNLTIEYVQRSDEASYTCKVSNVLQPTLTSATTVKYDTRTFHLNVLYGAENLILQLNNESHLSVEIEEHSTNHMRCSLESDPGSYMAFTKDGTQLIARNEIHQLTYDLRAECSDKGVYTCFGYNRFGVANNASVTLFVKCSARRPPEVDVKLIYNARQHENATLVYQIVAYPEPKPSQFVWKRCMNTSCAPLPNDMKKFKIDTEGLSSNLTVLDVQIEDYRIYQLSVSNGVGDSLVERFHLRPSGKPDLPTDVHIIQDTITDRTAVLTWIPGIDNGSPQEFYVSYRKLVDETSLVRLRIKHDYTKEMYYKIENLEPGTKYLVSLFAANEEGSTALVNDTFETLERISDYPVNNPNTGSIVGGAIGGTVGAIVAIVVIVVILRRQYLLKCYICPNKKTDSDEQSVFGTDNPGSNAAQAHEDVSVATGTSVYDVLRDGDKGSDNSHVYMTLNESSQKPQGNYENVKKEDPVYNNAVQTNPVQTVL